MAPNRYFVTEPWKQPGRWKFQPNLPQKKNKFLTPIVEKYTAVIRSFWGKFGVKARLQYSKLDGNNYSTHFKLEIAFLLEFRPKKE